MVELKEMGHIASKDVGEPGLSAETSFGKKGFRFSFLTASGPFGFSIFDLRKEFGLTNWRQLKTDPFTEKQEALDNIKTQSRKSRIQNRKSKHLKSFTLLESVTAITIITLLIGVSAMIYGNVVESEKPMAYYQAKQDVARIYQNTKADQAFFTKNFGFETYDIEQAVEFYKGNKKLYQINYTISSKGDVWWTEQHLVANKQNAL